MASFNDYLTTDGKKIFALMAQGSKVTFTKVVLGDGIMKDGVSESDMSEVISPIITLGINSVTKSADNKVTIRSVFSNTQTINPFYFREKGVYATTDGTDECLVFYANNGSLAEYIDVAKTQLIEKVIRTVIMFSESDNIKIELTGSGGTPPTITTDADSIDDFVNSELPDGTPGIPVDMEPGTTIIFDFSKDVYMYTGGDVFNVNNYVQVYGTKAMVIMHEYVPIEKRIKGSMYLQIGKTRRLIIKVFRQFYRRLPNNDTYDTLLFKETDERTTNIDDGNKYRFTCTNLSILQQGDTPERLDGKIYLIADSQ